MGYHGDLFAGAILRFPFTTIDSTGLASALSGTPAVSVYKDDGTTESSAGVTLTPAFDGRVGYNMVKIDTSQDLSFYATGHDFSVMMLTGSVAGIFIGGYELGEFSIENRPVNLGQWRGTVPNLLTAALNVQVDVEQWRTGSPNGLTASKNVKADLEEWLTTVPNALIAGRVDAIIGAVTAGAITSAAFAANALDAVWSTATRILTAGTNIVLAKGTGITGFNDLDAAGIRSAIGLASANLDTQLSTIAGYIDTEVAAIKAKTDQLTFTIANKVDATIQAAGDFAQGAADKVWSTATRILTAGTNIVLAKGTGLTGLNDLSQSDIRTAVGLASANLDTQLALIASYIDTEVSTIINRIGAFTGSGVNTVLGFLQAMSRKSGVITPSDMGGTFDNTTDSLEAQEDQSSTPPTVQQIVNGVWDEAIAGHLTAGTTGKKLNDASAAGDPLSNTLPGSYAPGTAGADIYATFLATQNIVANQVIVVSSPVDGNTITGYIGTLWNFTITGLGDISSYTKLYFTVKRDEQDGDSAALSQVVLSNPGVGTDGLIRANGGAATASDGSITINNATTGSITIKVKATGNQMLRKEDDASWDLKMIATTSTGPVELAHGDFVIARGETAAIS